MDNTEARALLNAELAAWRTKSHAELSALVGESRHFERVGRSGAQYQLEIEVMWDGDLARAVVRQHADRRARRSDGLVHHVETWVTQREIWRRTFAGWKLYRVDGIRDQRRLIDGQPG